MDSNKQEEQKESVDKVIEVLDVVPSGLSYYPTGNSLFAWRLAAKAQQTPPEKLTFYKRPTVAELRAVKKPEVYSEETQSFKEPLHQRHRHHHHQQPKPLQIVIVTDNPIEPVQEGQSSCCPFFRR